MPSFQVLLTALALGVSSHVLFFIRGEHHMRAPLLSALIPITFVSLALVHTRNETLISSLQSSTLLCASFAAGLYSSIVTYRLFFHPLRDFPGPSLARVSKFWHVVKVSSLRNHLLLQDLHKKYGDIVRTGPNEVVVFAAKGVPAVHGPASKCIKSDWYDMLQADRSIHATRKPNLHSNRRRIWDQGFSIKALESYKIRVQSHVRHLEENLMRAAGKIVDCTQLFLYFGFDVMGDTAFGESFDMVRSNTMHSAVNIMRAGLDVIGTLTPVPWLVRILASVPQLNRDWAKFESWVEEQVAKRIRMDRDEGDVMSKLIHAARDPNDTDKIDMYWLTGDSTVIVIAGSDTVSIALTFLFYHLARMPEQVEKLRAELDKLESIDDYKALQSLPHLNGLINETLRLYPPVITAPLRVTPPEGITIEGKYIPGGVNISTPLYILGRLESSYVKASEFIPERWYTENMIKDKSGFAPFLTGAYSCLGKQLALMELRLVTSALVSKYDFKFPAGNDGSKVLDIKDCFTAQPGPLELVFKLRGEE